jgi:hypothetical protein
MKDEISLAFGLQVTQEFLRDADCGRARNLSSDSPPQNQSFISMAFSISTRRMVRPQAIFRRGRGVCDFCPSRAPKSGCAGICAEYLTWTDWSVTESTCPMAS